MSALPTAAPQSVSLPPADIELIERLGEAVATTASDMHSETRASARDQPLEVVIIDDRPLLRDCFGSSLIAAEPKLKLTYFADVEAFETASSNMEARIVLLCMVWSKSQTDILLAQMERIKAVKPGTDIIVVSDIGDLDDILTAIEHGMRGYIPTSDRLAVAVMAIQLVAAGGIYVPPNLLVWSGRLLKEASQPPKQQQAEAFTSRQMAVIEALRRGKANKTIAYELNMCESTVKVHIRNVMKKLHARNRTELAYLFNDRMQQEAIASKYQ